MARFENPALAVNSSMFDYCAYTYCGILMFSKRQREIGEKRNNADFLREIRPASTFTDMQVYCVIDSVACYMFRPPIVSIFREMFSEECIIKNVKIM
jgi:hypothetical protein